MSTQHWHGAGLAAHSLGSGVAAQGSGFTQASFDAEKSGVPCSLHGDLVGSHHGDGPPPCDHGDCPSCPCACCAPMHGGTGILPQETVRTTYASLVSGLAAPPALLGSVTRFAAHSSQPRAPPALI
ncbi:MAG TPA: hypothetical protein VLZ74_16675 [Methylocella sp.]|nr:hypothetical protein [Methylocella sp.]